MIIEQTVEIPSSRRLFIDVPLEVPIGKAILTFTPASSPLVSKGLECAEEIWAYNRDHPEELKTKIQKLQGSLDENAFGGLNGVDYQCKVREEWDY